MSNGYSPKQIIYFSTVYSALLILYISFFGAVIAPKGIVDKPSLRSMVASYLFIVVWVAVSVYAGYRGRREYLVGALIVSILQILGLVSDWYFNNISYLNFCSIFLYGGCFLQGIVSNGQYSSKIHQVLIIIQPFIFGLGYYISMMVKRDIGEL